MKRLLRFASTIRQFARHGLCLVVNGGHELYTARQSTRLSQVCLLCGYETVGWTLEERPRFRRHLAGRPRPVGRQFASARNRWAA